MVFELICRRAQNMRLRTKEIFYKVISSKQVSWHYLRTTNIKKMYNYDIKKILQQRSCLQCTRSNDLSSSLSVFGPS